MKVEVSDFYKKKGVKAVYVGINKEPRRVATLIYTNGEKHSMSYAKYVYTSYYECDVAEGDQVDHIDKNKMNDDISNLQVISRKLNTNKSKMIKEFVELECPVCHEKFLFEKRNLSTHLNPCCSRKCGGIKSHITEKKIK
jgi:hypothetical protein